MNRVTIREFSGMEMQAYGRRLILIGNQAPKLAGWLSGRIRCASGTMKIKYDGYPFGVRLAVDANALTYKARSHAEAVGLLSLVSPLHSVTVRQWFAEREHDGR